MSQHHMSIEEFEKVYNECKSITIESPEDALNQIWEYEKSTRDIDWLGAEKLGEQALRDAVKKSQSYIDNLLKHLTQKDIEVGREIGILDSNNRTIDIEKVFFDTLHDKAPASANFPHGAPRFPVWGWNEETVKKYQNARGNKIKEYITHLIRSFQVMEQSDEVGIARICMNAGIWGFGSMGVLAAFRILKGLAALTNATTGWAVLQGVATVGINVVKLAVAIVVLGVLVPLMILMLKDAIGFFVIINKTRSDLIMNSVHFKHGKCIAGFRDVAPENTQAIIPEIFEIYNPNVDETIVAYSAGFFGVRKRDLALIGTQGALSFAPTKEYPDGIFLGWEVPLSQGRNRQLVSATYKGSMGRFSTQAGNSGTLHSSSKSSEGNEVEAYMNSGRGSQAYSFVIIN